MAYGHFAFFVRDAPTASGRLIAAEGAVREGHLASRIEKAPTLLLA